MNTTDPIPPANAALQTDPARNAAQHTRHEPADPSRPPETADRTGAADDASAIGAGDTSDTSEGSARAGTARSAPLGSAMLAPLRRWQLSRAKHPSLAGHARWSRRLTTWMPPLELSEADLIGADGAPPDVVARRRAGLAELSAQLRERHPVSVAASRRLEPALSDLQLTGRYRVPFPYAALVRQKLPVASVIAEARGARIQDLDGQHFIDLAGSYGVNLLGHDAYVQLMQTGQRDAASLGLALGPLHPCVQDNVDRLRDISGMDEVSFHMSGTEAVMQAVRLARYHSGRKRIVRFCGAYHGWWDEVQPGIGNPMPARDTLTLNDMSERTLQVLRTRHDIACVLVNPLQALHPNRPAPSDSGLMGARELAPADPQAYADWLRRLREVCSARGIALIMDEVFVGFRLARGGAQQRFGVQADLVVYGKTLGGGLPVGVLCGRSQWMRRYRTDRPADPCLARGTFNSHPMVMTTMNAFLRRFDEPTTRAALHAFEHRNTQDVKAINAALDEQSLPIRLTHLSSIWTLNYQVPASAHWLLQYYLRAHGVALSWVGTGRMITTLAHDEGIMRDVRQRLITAACRMRDDGWWWHDGKTSAAQIRRQMLVRMLRRRLQR